MFAVYRLPLSGFFNLPFDFVQLLNQFLHLWSNFRRTKPNTRKTSAYLYAFTACVKAGFINVPFFFAPASLQTPLHHQPHSVVQPRLRALLTRQGAAAQIAWGTRGWPSLPVFVAITVLLVSRVCWPFFSFLWHFVCGGPAAKNYRYQWFCSCVIVSDSIANRSLDCFSTVRECSLQDKVDILFFLNKLPNIIVSSQAQNWLLKQYT